MQIIDNEQKGYAFWSRIADYYATSPKLKGLEKREPGHISSKINEGVCRFVGSYEVALKEKSSGQNENDVMKLADHQIFSNDYDAKFTLEHAWRELRLDHKRFSAPSTKGSGMSKRRMCEESAQSSSSHPLSHGVEEPMSRPIGVKAAKAKAKKIMSKPTSVKDEGKAILEFQSMWEIKKKDLEMKEWLSKNKLLDSLLAITKPLSNIEVDLNNRLITDMLSNS